MPIKKRDSKSYFLTSSDLQICPVGKIFAPLYSTLFYLRLDMQHDHVCTKWILDPSGPHPLALSPEGLHQNSECVPLVLIHRTIAYESFEILA